MTKCSVQSTTTPLINASVSTTSCQHCPPHTPSGNPAQSPWAYQCTAAPAPPWGWASRRRPAVTWACGSVAETWIFSCRGGCDKCLEWEGGQESSPSLSFLFCVIVSLDVKDCGLGLKTKCSSWGSKPRQLSTSFPRLAVLTQPAILSLYSVSKTHLKSLTQGSQTDFQPLPPPPAACSSAGRSREECRGQRRATRGRWTVLLLHKWSASL